MIDPKAALIGLALLLLAAGAKGVAHGVKVAAVKTEHAVVRVFKHPVHVVKNGALKPAPGEKP
jgi:hypothetical protein